MQRVDVKKKLFQNAMILQRELCLCNFHIIYGFYTMNTVNSLLTDTSIRRTLVKYSF